MKHLKGKRIRLIKMGKDPNPLPAGSTGTVRNVVLLHKRYQLDMIWDPEVKRTLNLVCPPDEVEIIEE